MQHSTPQKTAQVPLLLLFGHILLPDSAMAIPLPVPNCPAGSGITQLIPMAHVSCVDKSAEFYSLLGFHCESRFGSDDGVSNWCLMASGDARLMLSRASGSVNAPEQAVLFYMYSDNVSALRDHLLQKGLVNAGPPDFGPLWKDPGFPAVFSIVPRFYMPEGELRIHDPDGYVILVGQADMRPRR